MAFDLRARPVRQRVWTAGRLLVLAAALLLTYGVFFLTAMRVATRAREVKVPDVRGQSIEEARAQLEDIGLTVDVEDAKRPDAKVPADHVLTQSPLPGSVLRPQRSVRIQLSDGVRAPMVPDVVGRLERTAEIALAEARVDVGSRVEIRTTEHPPGWVLAQDPPPTKRAAAVSLLVNRGEVDTRYIMPDLIGAPFDRAAAVLRTSNFRIAVAAQVTYPGVPPGYIVSQRPAAGFQVSQQNDLISVEVSK